MNPSSLAGGDSPPFSPETILAGLRSTLNGVLLGKEEVIEHVLSCLLARGHLLLDDLPGLGKTTLAKALAHAVGGRFSRIQCTPDLLPADITGFNMFNQQTRSFEFVDGPIFADVVLVDEINRATPRTQSALFEAMAEGQVTIDNHSRALSPSFFVIATQNPVESHGAYPLPEAQLDRFTMKLRIGYPGREHEIEMLAADSAGGRGGREWRQVTTPTCLQRLQEIVGRIAVSAEVRAYIVDLARGTREARGVTLGVSPRGLLTWQRTAQAHAFLRGRDFVTPDDVQEVARPVLEVRLAGEFDSANQVLDDVMRQIPVPVRHAEGAVRK